MDIINDNRGDLSLFYNQKLSKEEKRKLDIEYENMINNLDNIDFWIENYPEEFAPSVKETNL